LRQSAAKPELTGMRETSRNIERAAAEWAARLDRAVLSAQEEDAFDAWLQGDLRRQGALLRAQALLVREDESRGGAGLVPVHQGRLHVVSSPSRAARPPRKGWMSLGGALAACVAMAILVLSVVDAPKAYATVKGEIRTIPLADGSTVTLNTDTRIRVHEDRGQSRIQVLRGEVFVQSASDGRHPLTVEVEGRTLHAAQAMFNVSKLDSQPWQLTVHNGQVEVEGPVNAPATVVASNVRLSGPLSGARVAPRKSLLSADEVERLLAWREGKIAFHGETMAEAARTFSRYSDTRIVLADPALASQQVIGLYAANNPVGFARAAARVLDARVELSAGQVVISAAD